MVKRARPGKRATAAPETDEELGSSSHFDFGGADDKSPITIESSSDDTIQDFVRVGRGTDQSPISISSSPDDSFHTPGLASSGYGTGHRPVSLESAPSEPIRSSSAYAGRISRIENQVHMSEVVISDGDDGIRPVRIVWKVRKRPKGCQLKSPGEHCLPCLRYVLKTAPRKWIQRNEDGHMIIVPGCEEVKSCECSMCDEVSTRRNNIETDQVWIVRHA